MLIQWGYKTAGGLEARASRANAFKLSKPVRMAFEQFTKLYLLLYPYYKGNTALIFLNAFTLRGKGV